MLIWAETMTSRSREIRGRIADQANKLISRFYGLGAHLSASNFPGAATSRPTLGVQATVVTLRSTTAPDAQRWTNRTARGWRTKIFWLSGNLRYPLVY